MEFEKEKDLPYWIILFSFTASWIIGALHVGAT